MPYRGEAPRRSDAPPPLTLPSRLLAGGAIAVALRLLVVAAVYTHLDAWRALSRSGAGSVVIAIFYAGCTALVGGAVVLALRSSERDRRDFAIAGAALTVALLVATLWLRLVPAPPAIDPSNPPWAPLRYLVRPVERVSAVTTVLAPCLLVFALAPRHVRALPLVAAALAGGVIARELVDAAAVPAPPSFLPSPAVEDLVVQITRTLAAVPAACLALAALVRHDGRPAPTNEGPYLAVPFVASSVAVLAAGAGAFGTFYEMAMTVRGDRILRLEPLVPATTYAHGALVVAAVFVIPAARHAGRRSLAVAAGMTTSAGAIISTFTFMRHHWQFTIATTAVHETTLQLGWALCVAAVLVVGAKLTHDVRREALAAAARERLDLATALDATIGKTLRHAFFAAVTGAASIVLIAAGETASIVATRDLCAHAGGLLGLVAIAFAFGAVLEHARRHAHVDEGIRRGS